MSLLSGMSARVPFSRLRFVPTALLVLLLVGLPGIVSASGNPRMNVAGLVIKHGDGSVLYYYVRFSEPEITGLQLLQRAGVAVDVVPYAGMGQAVCRIDGEGCPSTNCFCKSYANPAYYWRYHRLSSAGRWIVLPYGPDERTIHNGDVDGWSWSSQDGDLPVVTLDQIARMNGVAPPAITTSPSAIVTTSPTALATNPTAPQTAIVSPVAVISQTASSPQPAASAVGVEVKSSGQTRSVTTPATSSGGSQNSFIWYGVGVMLMVVVGVVVVARRRRNEP